MELLKKVGGVYLPLASRYKRDIFLTMLFFGVSTLLNSTTTPLLIKSIMDTVASGIETPNVMQSLTTLFALLVLSRMVTMVSYRIGDAFTTKFQVNTMHDISVFSFKHLSRHSYEFFSHQFTGSLVSNTNKLVRSFEQIADFFTYNLFSEGSRLIISTCVLFYFSVVLGFIFIGLLGAYFIIYTYMVPTKIEIDEARNAAESRTTGTLADSITNILSIKMFAQTTSEWAHFGRVVGNERTNRMKSWNYSNRMHTYQRLLLVIFELAAIGAALYLWSVGSITAGTIVLLQIYLISATDIVFNLSRNFTRTLGAFSDAAVMVDILNTPESVADPKYPEIPQMTVGKIEIRDMSFAYTDSSKVFSKFNLTIPAGQKVGLVGHSGSGKTTITKLLLRFVDVQSGSICIDGQDIRNVAQDDLRAAIAYVPQEPLLFHRTIAENIAYGKHGATSNEIEQVAARAHAHDFISRLPQGYDTLVGERGVRLSGGERQRVAIARAMIKNAPILMLDEATSALDSMSEKYIAEAFDEAMQGRTTIVIAHRLSTIQKMDRIIVFAHGKIVEDGTHADLLAKNGTYAELWQQQAGGFIADETDSASV
jgi:ATP-binding cassette, subfamily B, bacterial